MEAEVVSELPVDSQRLVGTVINAKYRVLASVGAGGMGMIYRAEQLPLGRAVALKILRVAPGRDLATDLPHLKKRFFREASILAKLQHPNIVTIYDYGAISEAARQGSPIDQAPAGIESADEQYFMAMEFLSGRTLAERIAEGPMPIAGAVRIASQIARGLGEAHAQGVVHRDLKPSNVMLVTGRDGEERVKIIDFGIVKIVGGQPHERLTLDGAAVGSPKYMAPEQFLSSPSLDRRADVWALGVVLYRLLTGAPPFDAETTGWLIHDVLNATAPRVSAARAEMPGGLDDIVARCLERSPARRYGSMDEVANALDALGLGAPSGGVGRPLTPDALPIRLQSGSESTPGRSALAPAPPRAANGWSRLIPGLAAIVIVGAIGLLARRPPTRQPAPAAASASATTTPATIDAFPQRPSAVSSETPSPPSAPAPTGTTESSASAAPFPTAAKPASRPKRGRTKLRDDDIPAVR